MARLFTDKEMFDIRQHVETRKDLIEDHLDADEIELLNSKNYKNALWYSEMLII